jgi:hypothetical protein
VVAAVVLYEIVRQRRKKTESQDSK